MSRRYRCKECDEEFETDRPTPPDRCPNGACGAKFSGGWADNLIRLS